MVLSFKFQISHYFVGKKARDDAEVWLREHVKKGNWKIEFIGMADLRDAKGTIHPVYHQNFKFANKEDCVLFKEKVVDVKAFVLEDPLERKKKREQEASQGGFLSKIFGK